MGLDPLSPVAPARVRCLLVPCGLITRPRFLEFVKRLQEEAVVRLGDVSPSPNPTPERNTFSPLAFPQGAIIFDLAVAEATPGQKALYPYEVSREPLIVLGLADAVENDLSTGANPSSRTNDESVQSGQALPKASLEDLASFADSLKAIANVALVHKVLLFDYDGSAPPKSKALVTVPSPVKATVAGMKTLMGDLASELLAEMAMYARTIQALPTVETPKRTMPDGYVPPSDAEHDSKRQSWFPGARSSSPGLALQRLGQRASLPAHLFQSGASSPADESGSGATSPTGEAATTFDQMGMAPDRRATQMESTAHDRPTSHAFGNDPKGEKLRNQGRGRVSIVIGQLYLAAGRWPDAMRELVQGGVIARSTNDHIWHAKAVETVVVTLLMCVWAGVDFDIPTLCLPIAERSSVLLGKSSKKNEVINVNETYILQNTSKEAQAEKLKSFAKALPDIVLHIIRLYTRTTAEHVSQLALSESFIRLSKLSAFLLLFPSFSTVGLMETIVLNEPIQASPQSVSIVSLSSPAKAEVAAVASASLPPQGLQGSFGYLDRITIYAGVATVHGMLGFHRKKAFILRELIMLLLPALQNTSERHVAGQAMLASPLFKSPNFTSNGMQSLKHEDVRDDDDSSLYSFLASICRTYGAVIMKPRDSSQSKRMPRFENGHEDAEQRDEGALLAARIEDEALTKAFGGRRLKMDVLFMCISVCEVVSDLPGMIIFAGSLLRTVGSGAAPGPQDVDSAPYISPEDQMRASGAIAYAATMAPKIGLGEIEAEYWDDFVIRDIEILPITPDLALTSRKKSDLAAVKATVGATNQGPFIVNQFTARNSTSKRELVMATGEKFSFAVLIQNLYDINLDIDLIEIDATGVELDAKLENIVVGPYKTQRLRLIAQALEPGPMVVRGCLVKIRNCNVRRYPIFRDRWRPSESQRLKNQGLSTIEGPRERPTSTASEQLKAAQTKKPVPATLEAKIVSAQPRLTLKANSITQENLIVYEGERRRINFTFHNESQSTIDFVALSFDDSTLPILQAAVSDRELSAADLYEVEYGIYRKAALSWIRAEGELHVEPGKDLMVEVEVLGKPGLVSGSVQVDYAVLGPTGAENDMFYTRRLPVQFAISVIPSIDLIRNDILTLSGPLALHQHLDKVPKVDPDSPTYRYGKDEWTQRLMRPIREKLAMPSESQEYCLLQLDFYNSCNECIFVQPEICKDPVEDETKQGKWGQVFTTIESIDPGRSTRFLIPVPRVGLADPYAPIPSINPASKRQFVVSTGKINEGYERSSRDAFWHREEILKRVRVRWEILDSDSPRGGSVELRAIRLTTRMLDALKLETMSVRIGVDGPDVRQLGPSHFRAKAEEFLTVRTRITNQSAQPVHAVLRLQPSVRNQAYNVALDLSRKFVYTGTLQQPLAPIEPGATRDVELGAMFLCEGEFEIGASLEEMRLAPKRNKEKGKEAETKRDRAGSLAELDVLSKERTERRIWFAKEVCKVDVEEPDDV